MSNTPHSIDWYLTEAIVLDDLPKVKELVTAHGLPSSSYAFLLDAVKFDRTEIAKFLIQEGAELNSKEYDIYTPLRSAVVNGDLAQVQQLITADSINIEKDTPLHIAVENGNEDIVRLFLNKGAGPSLDKSKFEPLHIACFKQSVSLVKLLLSNKSQLESADTKSLIIALLIASQKGNEEIASLLLNKGADPNVFLKFPLCHHRLPISVSRGGFPLHLACEGGHLGVVKLLLEQGQVRIDCVRLEDGFTPLHAACENGHTEIVRYLLGKHAGLNIAATDRTTPLHLAAKNGYLKIVDALCKNGAKIDARSRDGFTPLLLATKNGHAEVVKMLLYRGSCVNIKNKEGNSVLYFVVENGRSTVSSCVLQFKPDIDRNVSREFCNIFPEKFNSAVDDLVTYSITTKHKGLADFKLDDAVCNGYGKAFAILANNFYPDKRRNEFYLPAAVENGHNEMIRLLLKLGCNIEQLDDRHNTPVAYLFEQTGKRRIKKREEHTYFDTLRFLVSNGADLKKAQKLLGEAVENEFIEISQYLIENGADVNFPSGFKASPLHHTMGKGSDGGYKVSELVRRDIARLLLNNGADVNARNFNRSTPLILAARNGWLEVVRTLLEFKADINLKDFFSNTPLLKAIESGCEDVVEILLKNRAKVNDVSMSFKSLGDIVETPLYFAVLKGHVEIVELLLRFDANINMQDNSGRTALHIALSRKQYEVIPVLLQNGCDVSIENSAGKTAVGSVEKVEHGIRNTLVAHILKLKTAGLFLNSQNTEWLREMLLTYGDKFKRYEPSCIKEVERMKQAKLCCHLSLYNALMNPNHFAFITDELIYSFESVDFNQFPRYGTLIQNMFKKNKKINTSKTWLNVLIKTRSVLHQDNLPNVPLEVLLKIISYLNHNDLCCLIECGETLKRQLC